LSAAWRPPVEFGAPWHDIALAWAPEGVLFGFVSFLALRFLNEKNTDVSGISIAAAAYVVLLSLPVWVLGAVIPPGTALNSFASQLQPLRDVFLQGGLAGGILAGAMTLVYAAICAFAVLGELLCAALWAALVTPSIAQSAATGRITLIAGKPFGAAFGSAVLAGGAFWIARLLIISAGVENMLLRGGFDAFVTIIIIGVYARTATSTDTSQPTANSIGGETR